MGRERAGAWHWSRSKFSTPDQSSVSSVMWCVVGCCVTVSRPGTGGDASRRGYTAVELMAPQGELGAVVRVTARSNFPGSGLSSEISLGRRGWYEG